MKRSFILILAVLVAGALLWGIVHLVLVAAHVSEPAATTVQGATARRLWASAVALLALVSVIIGGIALRHSANRVSTGNGRLGAIALVGGLIAAVNGGLNLAVATGGLGSGNGVVGGAVALVLGLIAMGLGGLVLARSRRTL